MSEVAFPYFPIPQVQRRGVLSNELERTRAGRDEIETKF